MRTSKFFLALCLVGSVLLAGAATAADDPSADQTQGRSEVAIDDSLPVLAASVPTSSGTVFVPVYAATDTGGDSAKFSGYVYGGGQDVDDDDDSSKFQEYSSHPEGFVFPGFLFQYDAGDYYWYLKGQDVGQWDHRIDLGAGSPGLWNLDFYWDRIPHNLSYDSRLIFDQVDGNEFRIADADQAALAALVGAADYAGVSAYLDSLAKDFNLQQREDFYGVNFSYRPFPEWDVNFGYERQEQEGYKAYSSNVERFQAVEVPLPIDWTTDHYDVSAEWTGKKGFLGGRIEYQDFDNGFESVIFDQPFRTTTVVNSYGSEGASSLAPDNDAIDFMLNGGINWGKSHRFTALLSWGQWQQDDEFMPFTISTDPALQFALDERSLDGEINRTVVDLNYTGRFGKIVGLDAWYRFYGLDNETPRFVFEEWVNTDFQVRSDHRGTLPNDYDRQNLGFDLDFAINQAFSLTVGYELESWNRDYREVENQDEDIASLKFEVTPGEKWAVRGGLELSWRRYDEYDYVPVILDSYPDDTVLAAEEHLASGQRKFDEAERDRLEGNLQFLFNPNEKWSFSIAYDYWDNDYQDLTFGLLDEESQGIGFDFSWNPIERFGLFGTWAYETYEWNERQIYRAPDGTTPEPDDYTDNPLDEWSSHNEDSVYTWGLGFKANLVKNRLDWDASYWVSDAEGELDTDYVPGGNASSDLGRDYPTVVQDWERLETYLRIYGPKGWEFVAGFEHEKWDSENFKLDVMDLYMQPVDSGATRSSFLGAKVPGYSADIFSFLVGYKW